MECQVEEPSPIEDTPIKDEFNKNDSEFIGDLDQMKPKPELNNKSSTIEFINGPAKLKKKWVDFMGGQSVVDSMELSKNDVKRQEIIYEMIDTERDYVNDLSTIIELYIQPLQNNNIISKKDINTLFSSIEQIYGVNKELLSLFEKRQQENHFVNEIGDIWLAMNDYLKIYLLYCTNYSAALSKLEGLKTTRRFSNFLNTQWQKPESRGLNLDSFLVKPVQRICKYPLLLKELLKYSDKSNKDYGNLKKADEKLQSVVNIINGASKVIETINNLIDLQSRFTPKISIASSNRKINYKCEITIYLKKLASPSQTYTAQELLSTGHHIEKKQRLLYIFNDMVIIAKSLSQEPDKLDKGKLKLIEMREFSDIEVDTNPAKDPSMENIIEILLANPDIYGIIFCENEEEKTELLNQLTSAMKEYQTNSSHVNNPKVVKRLPSEKVYSMISNLSKNASDLESELDKLKQEEEIEEEEEKAEAEKEEVLETIQESEPLTLKEKIQVGFISTGLVIVALFGLVISLILCHYIEKYSNYTIPGILILLASIQYYIYYKKEKVKNN